VPAYKLAAIVAALQLCGCSSTFPLFGSSTDPRIGKPVNEVQDQYVAAGATCRPVARDQILCDLINCRGCRAPYLTVLITFDLKTFEVTRVD